MRTDSIADQSHATGYSYSLIHVLLRSCRGKVLRGERPGFTVSLSKYITTYSLRGRYIFRQITLIELASNYAKLALTMRARQQAETTSTLYR